MKLPHWFRCRWGRWHLIQERSKSGLFARTVQYRQCLDCCRVQRRVMGDDLERPNINELNERLGRERVGEW